MATEKRQVEVDLLARNKMGPAAQAAANDLGKVGKAADKAADSAEDMGKASALAGEGAEKLGDKSDQAARQVDQLNGEIKSVERELVGLAAAFTAAGSAAERLDISKAIRSSQAELRRLKTSKGILEGILPDPAPIAKSFMTKLGGALATSAPALGAAAGVPLATALIASVSTALPAAMGAGVLGVGIAAAVGKDKEIAKAGQNLAKRFADGFSDGAVKHLKGPITQSMGILSSAGDRVSKSWESAFLALSDSVVPLVGDIVTGAERINEAVINMAKTSAPALKDVGDAWILMADGSADALESISASSEKASGGLVVLSGVIADSIRLTGNQIQFWIDMADKIGGPAMQPFRDLRDHYRNAANESKTFVQATAEVTGALTAQQRAATGSAAALADLNTELRAQADPVFALREAQIKLTEAQHASAKAIEKHGKNSKEAKEATRDLAKAALDMQGAAGKLGDDFNGKLTPAMRATLKAAGLTKGQINDVEREFGAARKAGNAFAKTYASTVRVNGAPQARRLLFGVKDIIDGIPRAVNIAMRITGTSNVSAAAAAVRKNARASGGPVRPGEPYWVGEEGPELIMPMAAGQVLTATKSRMMSRALPVGPGAPGTRRAVSTALSQSLAGSPVPTIRVDVTGAEGKFKAWIRELYRTGQLP